MKQKTHAKTNKKETNKSNSKGESTEIEASIYHSKKFRIIAINLLH